MSRLGKAQQLDAEYKIAENAGAAARAVGQAASSGLDALLGWMDGGQAQGQSQSGQRPTADGARRSAHG